MIQIRLAAERAVSRVALYLASVFETRLDTLIAGFVKLDGRLERYIERQQDRMEGVMDAVDRSYDREHALREAERDLRYRAWERGDAVHAEIVRAQRIRSAVRKLID